MSVIIKNMKKNILFFCTIISILTIYSCNDDDNAETSPEEINSTEWKRELNPVLRDTIIDENFEVASDAHVFMEDQTLRMIYTGDENGKPAIKLAAAKALNDWSPSGTLVGAVGPSGLDSHKETGFYRKDSNGKHQIYYIGYDDEVTYEAQIFLAEADSFEGPYTQMDAPVIAKGLIAGKEVHGMTSPSVVEHQGTLYMSFIGWDNAPNLVTKVWVMGAISNDNGKTWSDFKLVDSRIGMEGQITKVKENEFIAVRTSDFEDKEAIFYATASHPFGPWTELEEPILVQAGPPFEKDEIIAPQIFVDRSTKEEILFYTGADHLKGWWIMMARE